MSTQDVAGKAERIKELRNMQQELVDEIAALEDAIKAELTARGTNEIIAGAFKVRWTTYTATRLDAKALKAELPEIAARYTVEHTTRRFSVA